MIRLIMDVCTCALMHLYEKKKEEKRLACMLIHLTLHKHLIYVFSFTDHTLRVAKVLKCFFHETHVQFDGSDTKMYQQI